MRRIVIVALLLAVLCAGAWADNALGIPDTEYNALIALYNSTNGPGWSSSYNWLTDSASWYGVTVTDGHVQELYLPDNQLSGTIPPDIGNLTNLTGLVFENNQLSGNIPRELCSLINLQSLNLGNNQLTGTIPSEIGNLTSLVNLELDRNQLSGTIPPDLGKLTNLVWGLSLSSNKLSGTIPVELGNLTNLLYLYLDANQLTGSIPIELGSLSHLQHMSLNANQLSGTIPSELGGLTSLLDLDLEGNQLSGTIPIGLSNLVNLNYLWLDLNQLSGTIPPQFGNLAKLSLLDLDNNQLTGPIPAELGNLTNLWALALGSNHLSGPIPAWIGDTMHLNYLWLDHNQFSGPIPSWLFDINFYNLDLSSNQLVGEIPASIVNLPWLYPGEDGTIVSYNGLTSSDPTVLTFMAWKFPDWQNTQTAPPTGVAASGVESGSTVVSWTPIPYTGDGGYYEVGVSQTSGGPYTFGAQNRTAGKSASQLTVTGLASGANYLVVRTVTPANANNQNAVTSLTSPEVRVVAVVDKSYQDGSRVEAQGVVTAAFQGFFYVENQNRSCGIRVVAGGAPGFGMLDVSGALRTNASGERYIDASSVAPIGPGSVSPLGLPNAALGGGDWFYNSATGAGQCGVWAWRWVLDSAGDAQFVFLESAGLNNIGLLVKTWGTIAAAGRGWFYLDDGSGLFDGSGNSGVYVEAEAHDISVGAYVCVIGIASCDRYQGSVVNTLLATKVSRVASSMDYPPPPPL